MSALRHPMSLAERRAGPANFMTFRRRVLGTGIRVDSSAEHIGDVSFRSEEEGSYRNSR